MSKLDFLHAACMFLPKRSDIDEQEAAINMSLERHCVHQE